MIIMEHPVDPELDLRFTGPLGLGGAGDLIWTDDCTHLPEDDLRFTGPLGLGEGIYPDNYLADLRSEEPE